MDVAVKVEGLSKAYQLGQFSTGTLSQDLQRWWYAMLGKEDPFLKIGEANDRTVSSSSNIVWSLKDINFEVNRGEAVGIIGRNGAGKSTLLKVLSQVTSPTAGTVKINGRIVSLLEVGTGFHPELSGRENIFLNGAILGMRKDEIKKKFDEIVDFAGVERYIETPVKRYSSGMYVRLAFAVAAHLESEILIVDEVLAVGDAEFQKKCLGKMGEVSKGQGRTVLFVSHNMGAVNALCSRSILMDKGQIEAEGSTQSITSLYFSKNNTGVGEFTVGKASGHERVVIEKVYLKDGSGKVKSQFSFGETITVELELYAVEEYDSPYIWIAIKSPRGPVTAATGMIDGYRPKKFSKGANKVKCTFFQLPFLPDEYTIHVGIRQSDGRELLTESKDVAIFSVNTILSESGFNGNLADIVSNDSVSPIVPYEWDFDEGSTYRFDINNYVK